MLHQFYWKWPGLYQNEDYLPVATIKSYFSRWHAKKKKKREIYEEDENSNENDESDSEAESYNETPDTTEEEKC